MVLAALATILECIRVRITLVHRSGLGLFIRKARNCSFSKVLLILSLVISMIAEVFAEFDVVMCDFGDATLLSRPFVIFKRF